MVTPGICIAGISSGSGKTTITTGIIETLARRMRVAPFKVGPDYIDTGYHGVAAGRVGRNLDAVLCTPQRIGPLYAHGSAGCDIAVVEGVMGLFDGRISDGAGSTAHIASLLGVPVVLVVDARGMSQSIAAVVRGFATHDPSVRVAGVIVNHVGSGRHGEICRTAVEDSAGVPVVGVIPRLSDIEVPSRHLGLVTALEHGRATHVVRGMGDAVERYVDLDALVSLAACSYGGPAWDPQAEVARAREEDATRSLGHAHSVPPTGTCGSAPDCRPRIAVASGVAFTFSYAEHYELLKAAGADVVYFDPISDNLPDCDGIIIPGGFPEEHADRLAARTDLREQIRRHVAAGKPVHGECAGLLWLVNNLSGRDMLGVIPTNASMNSRLTLGYREAVALTDSVMFRQGERVVGHEFHHTSLAQTHCDGFAPAWGWKAWHGRVMKEGFVAEPQGSAHQLGAVHASYLHVHPASIPHAVVRFVDACR